MELPSILFILLTLGATDGTSIIPPGTQVNVEEGDDNQPWAFCNVMIYRWQSPSHNRQQDPYCASLYPGRSHDEFECLTVALHERNVPWYNEIHRMQPHIGEAVFSGQTHTGSGPAYTGDPSSDYTQAMVPGDDDRSPNIYALPFYCKGVTHVHCEHDRSCSDCGDHDFQLRGFNTETGGMYDLNLVTTVDYSQTSKNVDELKVPVGLPYQGEYLQGSDLHILDCGTNTLAPTKAPTPPTKAPTAPTRSPTVTPTGGCPSEKTIEVCAPPHLGDCG